MIEPLKVGDRVRVRRSPIVLVGTPGHILAPLVSSLDFFFVQFDGREDRPRLMHVSELEPVAEADEDYS